MPMAQHYIARHLPSVVGGPPPAMLQYQVIALDEIEARLLFAAKCMRAARRLIFINVLLCASALVINFYAAVQIVALVLR